MIISASRRTDIPAFYTEWFMTRIREGYCTVPNPFNRKQITCVSLKPQDVDLIVFWTRHPRPLFPFLPELQDRGYRFYVQYTVMDNPRQLDTKGPSLPVALQTFRELADRIGPEQVIWRYDPIVFTQITDHQFHQRTYQEIAQQLRGSTRRSVISIVDIYRKLTTRLNALAQQGIEISPDHEQPGERFADLMPALVRIAYENGMEIVSCAEELDLRPYGIRPGKCIDDDYIKTVFGIDVTHKKDKSQRRECGCVESRDIGMYDSCGFGCQYCYATSSFERAQKNRQRHDPQSSSLLGWYDNAGRKSPCDHSS